MTDFKAALKEGFAAAERAKRAHTEIDDVLRKLREDVFAASNGNLLIAVTEFNEPILPTSLEAAMGIGPALWGKRRHRSYQALAATNPKTKSSAKELAKWNKGRDGYPCKVSWTEERQCEDRKALEKCLADLLTDSVVGDILRSLMPSSEEHPADPAPPAN